MKLTRLAAALLAGLIAAPSLPAQAQTSGGAGRTAVNPKHEDLKTDADNAYQKGDYNKVLDLVGQVLREKPDDHVALYLRGSARVEIGLATRNNKLVRDGIADSREAIKLGGSENLNYYLPYLSGMTRLAAVENRAEHAEVSDKVASDLLVKLQDLKPEEKANILYQRGIARVFLKKHDGAVSDFQQGIKLVPSHLGCHMGIADAQVAAGRFDKAEQAFGDAIQAFRNNPLVYNNRGMFLQQRGKYDQAQEDFSTALELDPNFQVAYINRGFTLLQSGQPAAAENDFGQALKSNPNQPMVYSLRANARLAQGKTQEAIRDQLKVVELDPNNPVARADLGFTRFFAQDFPGAVEAFGQAVRLDPRAKDPGEGPLPISQVVQPWQYWSMIRSGQRDLAQRQFGTSINKPTNQRSWPENLVALLAGRIEADELIGTIRDEKIRTAQMCEAHFFLGVRDANAGNEQSAADHFQKAVDTGAMHLSAYRGAQVALDRMKVARSGGGAAAR